MTHAQDSFNTPHKDQHQTLKESTLKLILKKTENKKSVCQLCLQHSSDCEAFSLCRHICCRACASDAGFKCPTCFNPTVKKISFSLRKNQLHPTINQQINIKQNTHNHEPTQANSYSRFPKYKQQNNYDTNMGFQ